jgi:HPt (histidine-containing phosphotransfer) domain-containing protein
VSDLLDDPLMGELRVRFRETTAARLREMRSLFDALDRDPTASDSLARHFHALSGLGATYGYPRVSELGEEGEHTTDVARWRELVDAIARALEPG